MSIVTPKFQTLFESIINPQRFCYIKKTYINSPSFKALSLQDPNVVEWMKNAIEGFPSEDGGEPRRAVFSIQEIVTPLSNITNPVPAAQTMAYGSENQYYVLAVCLPDVAPSGTNNRFQIPFEYIEPIEDSWFSPVKNFPIKKDPASVTGTIGEVKDKIRQSATPAKELKPYKNEGKPL